MLTISSGEAVMSLTRSGAVYRFLPFVAFGPDGDHFFQITDFAGYLFHFDHFAGNGRVYVGGNDAVGIGNHGADFDPVAFLDQNFGRRADMLLDRYIYGFGDAGVFDREI